DVGEVAAVLLGDSRHRAQLLGGQLPAGDAHPHHEVGRLDVGVLERARLAATDAGAALGVQAPPAEPAAQVGWVDRVETQVGVPVDDPLTDVQPVVVLLEALSRVQRLTVAQGPLALATPGSGWHVAGPSAASGPRRPHLRR